VGCEVHCAEDEQRLQAVLQDHLSHAADVARHHKAVEDEGGEGQEVHAEDGHRKVRQVLDHDLELLVTVGEHVAGVLVVRPAVGGDVVQHEHQEQVCPAHTHTCTHTQHTYSTG